MIHSTIGQNKQREIKAPYAPKYSGLHFKTPMCLVKVQWTNNSLSSAFIGCDDPEKVKRSIMKPILYNGCASVQFK